MKGMNIMSNDVTNKLVILCNDAEIMNKIKEMIFDKKKDKNQIFTMKKLLPLPNEKECYFGINHSGNIWRISMWGTSSDVYDCNISVGDNILNIYYETSGSSNVRWVGMLCNYIENILNFVEYEETMSISVKHLYHDYLMDYGGVFEWEPFKEFHHEEYSFLEYTAKYDDELFDWCKEMERIQKLVKSQLE